MYYKFVKDKKITGVALDREDGDCDYTGAINGMRDEMIFLSIQDCEANLGMKAMEANADEYKHFLDHAKDMKEIENVD